MASQAGKTLSIAGAARNGGIADDPHCMIDPVQRLRPDLLFGWTC